MSPSSSTRTTWSPVGRKLVESDRAHHRDQLPLVLRIGRMSIEVEQRTLPRCPPDSMNHARPPAVVVPPRGEPPLALPGKPPDCLARCRLFLDGRPMIDAGGP